MRVLSIVVVTVLAAAVPAQLEVTEVLVDPVGPNRGRQIVELFNDGNRPYDLTGHYAVAHPTSAALPSITLPPYQILRLHLDVSGLNGIADIYLPGFRELGASETFAVYSSPSFQNPADLESFVSWGGGTGLIHVATAAALWNSSLASVPLPTSEGHSIAHFGAASFTRGVGPEHWYRDGTPTLGLPNDPGSLFNFGIGCPSAANPPWMGVARPEARPWLGEALWVDLFNLPQGQGAALLVLGSRSTLPVPLDIAGMPGCSSFTTFDAVVVLRTNQGVSRWVTVIPILPQLVGWSFYGQALVPDPNAGNAAGALVTNAIVWTVGSR